ncbi:M4 family metallopeptidase [Mycolicibacterium pyrenivorans]|uniref:M4 family metallopeptidase n=1 Tax=Mycolicibacterium pyrenivorans TaxID=187102 RepID=UPI0021F2AED3|nr:M4 family metallopeptidase [Mycolicibacterium pyrenivorans]MCV7151577.1 M4 family metallopeptidase [Mycolicibacterium pyrenivorans]
MVRCDRQRTSIDPRRGLYAGVALIGIGLSLAVGQGVAAATPTDTSTSSQSAGTSAGEATDASPRGTSDDQSTEADPGASADAQEARDPAADESEATDEVDLAVEAEEAAENDADTSGATGHDGAQSGPDDDGSIREPRKSPEPTIDDASAAETSRAETRQVSSADAAGPTTAEPVGADGPAAESGDGPSATPAPVVATMRLAPPEAATGAPTLRDLVSVRPVTTNSIVADLLTWVGLGPLATGLPVPETPVSALMQSLWLAVRQVQYTLNNQRPTAAATISGPGPDGVVTGSLNAVDYDDVSLVYRVIDGPQRGSVTLDALGGFTYTPNPAAPLRGDRFTVTVDDTVGNPFRIHGLLGLLGFTGPTRVTIVVAAPPPGARPDPVMIGLTELLSRDGVEVTADAGGAVSVIEGRFTDRAVSSAADAAAVLNSVAPALGVAVGFAEASAITATQAGVGRSVENFYRLNESVGGVRVLGSDVILVADVDGAVTGLVNNYRGLTAGFDVIPDPAVDEHYEVSLIAGTAYLGAGADRQAIESLLAQSTFTTQLVVYALEDEAEPSLAWRVVMQLPDAGDMSRSGATYVIEADGADAGDIIVTLSNLQGYTTVGLASDWLGRQRVITFDTTSVFWSKRYTLVDVGRNIKTYKTAYRWFGRGSPILPGTVVKRGWFGWDRAAVSAHANTAVVYDFFEDVLGRTSFDGNGALIEVSIRYNPGYTNAGYANAFWDSSRQQFAYGDSGYLQAALDIVGHEFTHAVVSYVVGDGGSVLDYGESGALNEAYADILGVLVEGKSGADRWLVGEDSDYGIVRNLADPTSIVTGFGPYRAHYAARYLGTGDDAGEHINSTIFSHAVYRMMTAAATSGVSDLTWARVFYHSLFRLSPGAEFTDGRTAVLGAAAALGLTAAELGAIRDGFDSVGILGATASSAVAA